jgi:hypothetical protein
MNCLRTLLNRLADAASYWLQTPFDAADELWLNQPPRDGADRLAEREAEEEVWEPHSPSTSVVVSTEDHCDAFRAKALRDITDPRARRSFDAATPRADRRAQP